MERAEQAGLGIAVIGHVALFGALSLGLLAAPELPKIDSQPIEVTLATEVDLRSAAPTPPAVVSPPAPEPAPPQEPVAAPQIAPPPPPPVTKAEPKVEPPKPAPKTTAKAEPKPEPKPKPKPIEKAAAKPSAKAKDKPTPKPTRTATVDPEARRRPGLSGSIVSGLSDTPAPTPAKMTKPAKVAAAPTTGATSAPAGISVAQMTGAQKSSLNSLIYTQLKPYWKPPSGADAEQLITRLSVRLNKDGSLADDPELIDQQGINDSNRAQAKLHAERAIQAVRRAAPFKLPPEYYEAWKWLKPLKLYVGQPG
jgi:outer membrane biosynthesis protein TonB